MSSIVIIVVPKSRTECLKPHPGYDDGPTALAQTYYYIRNLPLLVSKSTAAETKVCHMEKWTGFRGRNSGSRVARAKWSSSADSSYNLQ